MEVFNEATGKYENDKVIKITPTVAATTSPELQALNDTVSATQLSLNKSKVEVQFYDDAENSYIAKKNDLQTRYDLIKADPTSNQNPMLRQDMIAVQSELKEIESVMELNINQRAPHLITLRKTQGDYNVAKNALDEHTRTMAPDSTLTEADILFLSKQSRIDMSTGDKKYWINKMGGSMEMFIKYVPMISKT